MPQPDRPLPDQPFRNPDRSPQPPAAGLGFLFAELADVLPEFVPRYLELVAAADDDPGGPTVLMEIAAFVAEELGSVAASEDVLGRALGLVEGLAVRAEGDDAGSELVSYAFFDSFTVEDRRLLASRLGPRSRRLLESLEAAADGWQ